MSPSSVSRLSVIVGFGGYNAAGRSSAHHAYRRMVIESLPVALRQETLASLGIMMGLFQYANGEYQDTNAQALTLADIETRFGTEIYDGSLVRRIEPTHFNVDAVHWQKSAKLNPVDADHSFEIRKRELPEPVPENWRVEAIDNDKVRVFIEGELEVKLDSYRNFNVKSAGQLPRGFDPAALYNARFHPRGLQLAVIAASDAVRSMGIPWETVTAAVKPDQIGVYASSVMSQIDDNGLGGLLQSRLRGGRVSTKQCPLGLNSMPADFVNAYILGSVGNTNAITGACASFLYNLRAAIEDIDAGRCRVAVVGTSEAPITSESIDGYDTMGALASEEKLKKLDGSEVADFRRASRPFGENCGFTIAESAQYIVLMDDALALELGADIHGAVNDVFVNADGFKKSISAPGPGNHITVAKAVASARAILGDEAIRERSLMQAHGSSTPQNRVTESQIFDQVAECFDIENWPVTAIKSYVGHPLSSASADQLMASLGVFKYGIVPGIKTIDKVADDVYSDRLHISTQDFTPSQPIDVAFLNSKGFGGNNATASVLAPRIVESMLQTRYGAEAYADYCQKRESVRKAASDYDTQASQGDFGTIYRFGENMIDEAQITMTPSEITLPGLKAIDLPASNRFKDMI